MLGKQNNMVRMSLMGLVVFSFGVFLFNNGPFFKKEAEEDLIPAGIRKLAAAYPNFIIGVEENAIIWKDSSRIVYDDGLLKDSVTVLNSPDLEEQMRAVYIKGIHAPTPKVGENAGRLRYEPLFKKMYGSTRQEVEDNLVKIKWLPKNYGRSMSITTVNDLHLKVQALSNELDSMIEFHKYLKRPGGSYIWRNISGSGRMSLHSFGIAIDINVKYSDYWDWSFDKENLVYKNRIPLELVEVFEKYGFIWGGKWFKYDTMHFEYRPELLID